MHTKLYLNMERKKGSLYGGHYYLTDGDGNTVGRIEANKPEYMERILALWRMAEELGLTTEDIEAGIVQDMKTYINAIAEDDVKCGSCGNYEVHSDTCAAYNLLARLDKKGA